MPILCKALPGKVHICDSKSNQGICDYCLIGVCVCVCVCVCVWRAQHIWILDYYSWCYQSKQVGSQVPLMKWTDRRQYQIYRYHIQNEKSELQMDLKILLGPDFSVIKICNNNFIKTIFNNKCKQFLISAPLMHPIKWWSNSQIIMYFLIILPFIEKATLILLNYTFFFYG
jgi:hypothetical protein